MELLAAAAGSLTRLDVAALEDLGQEAVNLASRATPASRQVEAFLTPEVQMRLADFAALVQATRENLRALERVGRLSSESLEQYGFFERIGLYQETEATEAGKPRGGRMVRQRS